MEVEGIALLDLGDEGEDEADELEDDELEEELDEELAVEAWDDMISPSSKSAI